MIDLEKTRDLAMKFIAIVLKGDDAIRLELRGDVLTFSDGQRYTDVVDADEYLTEANAAEAIVLAIANQRMQRKLIQMAEASGERAALYTVAPAAYDSFSTIEVTAEAGRDDRGRVVRRVSLEPRDLEWQTGRYASGSHAYASPEEAAKYPTIWRLSAAADRLERATDQPV